MNRYFLILINSLLLAITTTSYACGPDGCGTEFTLSAPECGLAALPFLAPQNDSRLNMAMLIADTGSYTMEPWQLEPQSNQTGYGSFFEAINGKQPLIASRYQEPSNEPPAMPTAFSAIGLSNEQWLDVFNKSDGYSNSACQSNGSEAVAAFVNALQSAALATKQAAFLVNTRLTLIGHCDAYMPTLPVLPTQGIAGEFSQYLKAIHAFYSNNSALADLLFKQLSNAKNAWVAETSRYMRLRVAIIAAQADALDEWGNLDLTKANLAQLKLAKGFADDYLQHYSQGIYARSAQGFYRRIAWLQQDQQTLSGYYAQLIKQGAISPTLLNEIDQRLATPKPKQLANHLPDWLFVEYLTALRQPAFNRDNMFSESKAITNADVKQRRQQLQNIKWQQKPQWLSYLPAVEAYYLEHNYPKTLSKTKLPNSAPRTWLNFSQRMLHGLALSALKQWPQAQQHWQQLLSQETDPARLMVTQLALAMTLERAGRLEVVYAKNTPISHPDFRITLLSIANAPLLRQVINAPHLTADEKSTAAYYLLSKDLSRQHYDDFEKDFSIAAPLTANSFNTPHRDSKKGYDCPPLIKTTNLNLLNNPNDTHALNCVADFLRQRGYAYGHYIGTSYDSWGSTPTNTNLAGTKDTFDGRANSSLDFYIQVIKQAKASDNDRAYALHRAIRCFAHSGNNNCSTQDISLKQRKKWFTLLKTRYRDTTWAQQQRVYW